MENLDEYFALENIGNHLFGEFFSPTTMNFGVEFNTSSVTENSASPCCNYLDSDSLNLLQFEPNSYGSSFESADLVQNQSNFSELESPQSVSSKGFELDFPSDSLNLLQFEPNSSDSRPEPVNLVQKQSHFFEFEWQQSISSKCFEFDVPSDSSNLLQSRPNSFDSSSELVNLVQKQSNFSISSVESVDFLKEKSNCFEFDFPSDSLNLLQSRPNSSDSSSESSNLVQNRSNFSRFESRQSISSNCLEFDFPSNSYNLLYSGPSSSLESANLVQNQSKFLRLKSQPSISSAESVDFVQRESKCFEFDFPSYSFNIPQVGPNSSLESANSVQNQSHFSRFESQPSISSAESVDIMKEKSKCFEFAPKPKIIIDLTSPKPKKTESQLSISRSESMKTKSKCFEFEVEPQVIIDLTSPKPRKPESQLSISSSVSMNFEQQTNSKCFEFEAEPKHPRIASSKPRNLHQRKLPSLKIDLSVLHGGVKRQREAEEGGGEEAAVTKFEKSVEEWPLTPSRWNSFWDENSNGMYSIPPLSPLSPHPPLGCAQLTVV